MHVGEYKATSLCYSYVSKVLIFMYVIQAFKYDIIREVSTHLEISLVTF